MMRAGISLVELLVASILSFVVILAIGHIDVTRIHLTNPLRDVEAREGRLSEAGLSWLEIARRLELADRVILSDPVMDGSCVSTTLSGTPTASGTCYQTVQLRVPQGTAFDHADNYLWFQYSLEQEEILGYEAIDSRAPDCQVDIMFRNIGSLKLQFQDVVKTPPGGTGKPFDGNEDNNIIGMTVRSADDGIGFSGAVALRTVGYTNLQARCTTTQAQLCDSGIGLAPPSISQYPQACS